MKLFVYSVWIILLIHNLKGCNVKLDYQSFQSAQDLNCDDRQSECEFRDCVANDSELCCDEQYSNMWKSFPDKVEGCEYTCKSSRHGSSDNVADINVKVTVDAKTGGCENYTIDYGENFETTVKLSVCIEGSSCIVSAEQAEQTVTHVFRWDCEKCKISITEENGQVDIFEKAPVLFNECCEKCKETIDKKGLNRKDSANFLICAGCDNEDSSLDNLSGYLQAYAVDPASVVTTMVEVGDYSFTGSLDITFFDGITEGGENIQNIECVGEMNFVTSDVDIRQFSCDGCTDDKQGFCCSECNAANERSIGDDSDNRLYDCKGCDNEDTHLENIVNEIHRRACVEFTEIGEVNCQRWETSNVNNSSGTISLSLLLIVSLVFLL